MSIATTKSRTKTKNALKTKPATPRRGGKLPRGRVAMEARWFAKVTLEENALLQKLADLLTDGNKSEMLRRAVIMAADQTIGATENQAAQPNTTKTKPNL